MNCSTCQNNLIAYLEEKLPIGMQSDIADHLESCTKCLDLFTEMKITYGIIDAEKAIECNPFLATRVMAAIESKEITLNREPAFKRILQTALIAASITIAVLGGMEAGTLYSTVPANKVIPDEMVYMNDAALESLNIFTTE